MNPIEYAEQIWKYANDIAYRDDRTLYDIIERTYNIANNFMTINSRHSADTQDAKVFNEIAKEALSQIYETISKIEYGN